MSSQLKNIEKLSLSLSQRERPIDLHLDQKLSPFKQLEENRKGNLFDTNKLVKSQSSINTLLLDCRISKSMLSSIPISTNKAFAKFDQEAKKIKNFKNGEETRLNSDHEMISNNPQKWDLRNQKKKSSLNQFYGSPNHKNSGDIWTENKTYFEKKKTFFKPFKEFEYDFKIYNSNDRGNSTRKSLDGVSPGFIDSISVPFLFYLLCFLIGLFLFGIILFCFDSFELKTRGRNKKIKRKKSNKIRNEKFQRKFKKQNKKKYFKENVVTAFDNKQIFFQKKRAEMERFFVEYIRNPKCFFNSHTNEIMVEIFIKNLHNQFKKHRFILKNGKYIFSLLKLYYKNYYGYYRQDFKKIKRKKSPNVEITNNYQISLSDYMPNKNKKLILFDSNILDILKSIGEKSHTFFYNFHILKQKKRHLLIKNLKENKMYSLKKIKMKVKNFVSFSLIINRFEQIKKLNHFNLLPMIDAWSLDRCLLSKNNMVGFIPPTIDSGFDDKLPKKICKRRKDKPSDHLFSQNLYLRSQVFSGKTLKSMQSHSEISKTQKAAIVAQILRGIIVLHNNFSFHGNLNIRSVLVDKNFNVKLHKFSFFNFKQKKEYEPELLSLLQTEDIHFLKGQSYKKFLRKLQLKDFIDFKQVFKNLFALEKKYVDNLNVDLQIKTILEKEFKANSFKKLLDLFSK